MGWMRDEAGLEKRAANYVPLTPLSHLRRAAEVFPDRLAVVYGGHRVTYAEYHDRVTRMASALAKLGVAPGDVVATVLPNIPAHVEAHFGVPAAGAVLNAINTRLDPATIAYILDHGEAKVLLCDSEFLGPVETAIDQMKGPAPTVIEVPDAHAGIAASGRYQTYDALLATGDAQFDWILPEDEWESIALNYTSGTTGRPKGVVYHHRGAYLITLGTPISWRMTLYPVYLTIVPLFHCNNWCHVWGMPALGGTVVCCRNITAEAIYDAIADEGVTHFGGAPIVLNMLVHATLTMSGASSTIPFKCLPPVRTSGGCNTESHRDDGVRGHAGLWSDRGLWPGDRMHLAGQRAGSDLDPDTRAEIKARQGVAFPNMEPVRVKDPDSFEDVPHDGETLGEIMIRGNATMKGYYKNPEATEAAFAGGYFRSGDLAVQYPDSYVEIKDRAKDIIISGGENVSSVEVESCLMAHEAVLLCAVVAKPDEKWGEVPCAFVELKPGAEASAEEIIAFARTQLAGFKTPKHVVFLELPKTSTGKIQKFDLRRLAKEI